MEKSYQKTQKDTKLKKTCPCPQAIEDLDLQLFRQSGPSSWRNVINHLLKAKETETAWDCYAMDKHNFDTENDLQILILWDEEIL